MTEKFCGLKSETAVMKSVMTGKKPGTVEIILCFTGFFFRSIVITERVKNDAENLSTNVQKLSDYAI